MSDKKKKEGEQDVPYHRYTDMPYEYCPENIPENIRDGYYRNNNYGYRGFYHNDEIDKIGRVDSNGGMRNTPNYMMQNPMVPHHMQIPMNNTMHVPGKGGLNNTIVDPSFYSNDEVSDSSISEKKVKKTGRKKISMEYIEGKNKRSVTFSKRKKGIMKKAFELNILTGTQILLLVASESGHVYTFATPKLKPIIQNHEKLIQSCLNAPLPSSPIDRRTKAFRNEKEMEDNVFMNYGDYYNKGYDHRQE